MDYNCYKRGAFSFCGNPKPNIECTGCQRSIALEKESAELEEQLRVLKIEHGKLLEMLRQLDLDRVERNFSRNTRKRFIA